MNYQEVASQMREEADRLIRAAALISPTQGPKATHIANTLPVRTIPNNKGKKRTGRRKLSAAARQKLSLAQQRRRERERAISNANAMQENRAA